MDIQQNTLPEYDKLKQQTAQRFNAQAQQQGNALKRKLASIGNLNSGAAIKQQEKINTDVGQQQEAALSNIDTQQAQELQRRKEIEDARNFEAAQAQKGMDFSAQQAALGRDFTASESALARKLQSDQFGQQFGLQNKVFKEQQGQNKIQNAMAAREAQLNEYTNMFNQAQALAQNKPQAQQAINSYFAQISGGNDLSSASPYRKRPAPRISPLVDISAYRG
jgi:hypothetical protein